MTVKSVLPPVGLTHDGKLRLSKGESRKALYWKPVEVTLSQFLSKLQTPVRTPETLASFLALSQDEQANLKDIGGYVGCTLKEGGRRLARNAGFAQVVILDADYFTEDGLVVVRGLGFFWVLHSTRKHQPGRMRVRIIIPLNRPVTPDEYQACARLLAAKIGIDQFDPTTFEVARMYFWPTASSDAEFLFEFNDARWVSADDLLGEYEDWRDSSKWPVPGRFTGQLRRSADRAGDPTEKTGLLGAFCRTYTIQQAIETFLADVYTPSIVPGRYTYTQGTSSQGLVTYEDKFAYSHHSTDPACGRLCNAWDLIRLHRYGAEDDGAKADTPVNRLPSTKKMEEFATGLVEVRRLLINEQLTRARADFGEAAAAPVEAGDADGSWKDAVALDQKTTRMKTTRENYRVILSRDPRFVGRLGFNEFSQRIVARDDLPWRKVKDKRNGDPWIDSDDANLRLDIERGWGVQPAPALLEDALDVVTKAQAFHPVRDYLNGLRWDGTPRLESVMVDFLGAEDSPYTRAVTRKFMVAAVARVMTPGVKFDHMPTLVGAQAVGKSTFAAVLGNGWGSDSLYTVHGKDAYEQLQGSWIIEMAELNPTRQAEVEAVKHFISKTEDRFRQAYAHRAETFPRQCVFIGSTNDSKPLRDKTGNRRFWIVRVKRGAFNPNWVQDLIAVRDQLWAEAVELWRFAEDLNLPPELEEVARQIQEEHRQDDGMAARIAAWLDEPVQAGWSGMGITKRLGLLKSDFPYSGPMETREVVCAREVWLECLMGTEAQFNQSRAREVNEAMRMVPGWHEVATARCGPYGVQRAYRRDLLNVVDLPDPEVPF